MPRGLRDSKQILEGDREKLFDRVASWCDAWAVGHAAPDECDRLGMTVALRLATRRALSQLPAHRLPDAVVLDGKFDFVSRPEESAAGEPPRSPGATAALDLDDDYLGIVLPANFAPVVQTVVKADASCVSVAAASVLAKVTRDRIMRESAECYPPFDFGRNKGYPSPTHQRALRGYGLSAIHRRTWVYVEGLPWARPEFPRLCDAVT
jgi:ribonuclease HII